MTQPSSTSLTYQQAHVKDDRRGGIIVVIILTLIFAYSAVSLRYLSRRLAGTSFGADDGWICGSLALVTANAAGFSTMVHYGFGQHAILVRDARALVISTTIAAIFYHTANFSIKISILFLYRRIFPSRRLRYVLIAVGTFALSQCMTFSIITIFHCIPIAALWTPDLDAKCVNYATSSFVSGILNVITDILILASPMHAVWHLNVSKARRRLITATFILGGIVSIISIIRLPYIRTFGEGEDQPYKDVPAAELSVLENGIGTLAACLPIYRPIYNNFFRKKPSTTHSRTYGQLLEGQPSISTGLTDKRLTRVAVPSRSTSGQEEGIHHSTDEEIGTGIIITREFSIAGSAREYPQR